MGVVSFLTTSDGAQVDNPRHLSAPAGRLAVAQRSLAACKRGSNRRRKVRERVAAIHGKVRRQRADHAYKTARWLVHHHDLIAHEDLRIASMTRSARGTIEAPGVKVAQKSGLNRSIPDAVWGVFLSILAAKAESAGRTIIAVIPANTSRTCPNCGIALRRTASAKPTSPASTKGTRMLSAPATYPGQGLPFRPLARPEKLTPEGVRGVTMPQRSFHRSAVRGGFSA